jgi:hypothetical protein
MEIKKQATALLNLLESKEGEVIYIGISLDEQLRAFAQRAIDENNKEVLSILLMEDKDSSRMKDALRKIAESGNGSLYEQFITNAIDGLKETVKKIRKYADFIENAPDDSTPASKEEQALEKQLSKIRQERFEDYNPEKAEAKTKIDRELCAFRKSNATGIIYHDSDYKFHFNNYKFADFYGSRQAFYGDNDYDGIVKGLRTLAESIESKLS